MDLSVHLFGEGKDRNFLVLKDLGCGMDVRGLKEFATYYLTQARAQTIGW